MNARVRKLIEQLGEAIQESVSESEQIAGVVQNIRSQGFDVLLMLEATIGLNEVEQQPETATAEEGAETFTAQDVSFLVNYYGADAEVDGQGRVLMPTDLRRLLEMENQPVWLLFDRGGVNVYNKEVFEERKQRMGESLGAKVTIMRKQGLK